MRVAGVLVLRYFVCFLPSACIEGDHPLGPASFWPGVTLLRSLVWSRVGALLPWTLEQFREMKASVNANARRHRVSYAVWAGGARGAGSVCLVRLAVAGCPNAPEHSITIRKLWLPQDSETADAVGTLIE